MSTERADSSPSRGLLSGSSWGSTWAAGFTSLVLAGCVASAPAGPSSEQAATQTAPSATCLSVAEAAADAQQSAVELPGLLDDYRRARIDLGMARVEGSSLLSSTMDRLDEIEDDLDQAYRDMRAPLAPNACSGIGQQVESCAEVIAAARSVGSLVPMSQDIADSIDAAVGVLEVDGSEESLNLAMATVDRAQDDIFNLGQRAYDAGRIAARITCFE